MNHDPNELAVVNDIENKSTPIEAPKTEVQTGDSENQPVIPTVEELNARPAQFNSEQTPMGVDPDAPYGRNKDGSPAKKRGRKAPTSGDLFDRLDSVTPSTASQARPLPNAARSAIVTDYRPVASLATGLFIAVPQMFLGADWAPEDAASEKIIADAFYNYFRAKGISEMSPELALGIALGSHAVSRINKPTVKGRIAQGVEWIKSTIKRRR